MGGDRAGGIVVLLLGTALIIMGVRGTLSNVWHALITPGSGVGAAAGQQASGNSGNGRTPAIDPSHPWSGGVPPVPMAGFPGSGVVHG